MTKKKKVLIIDDEKSLIQMMKYNLEQTGKYEVSIEDDGERGIAAAREIKPDLILLDIRMPGLSGREIERRIKSDNELKDVPVVFLTAMEKEDEFFSGDEGIDKFCFLTKPASLAEILDCIEKNLEG